MSEKKATDLLIEINSKLDLVLDYVKNLDFNYKLQSNKLNSLIDHKPNVPTAPVVSPGVITPALTGVDKNTKSVGKATEKIKDKISAPRKVTVQQRVLYPDDKPAVLAKVKIMDTDKKLIRETKTNHTGRWSVLIDPGFYFIHITKAEVAGKPKIDHFFETEITSSDAPIELEVRK